MNKQPAHQKKAADPAAGIDKTYDPHVQEIPSAGPDRACDSGPAPETAEDIHAVSPLPNPPVEEDKELSQQEGPPSPGPRKTKYQPFVPVHRWFVTFMCMNIPMIGWIYLIILALSPSKGPRRDFAKAYLLYKLIFLLLSLAILAVALHYGLEVLDKLLAYMEML